MDTIQIKDKMFTVSIKEQDILKEVTRVANEINRDLAGKNPLFLSVLNGSFMFTSDLMKRITIPDIVLICTATALMRPVSLFLTPCARPAN